MLEPQTIDSVEKACSDPSERNLQGALRALDRERLRPREQVGASPAEVLGHFFSIAYALRRLETAAGRPMPPLQGERP